MWHTSESSIYLCCSSLRVLLNRGAEMGVMEDWLLGGVWLSGYMGERIQGASP